MIPGWPHQPGWMDHSLLWGHEGSASGSQNAWSLKTRRGQTWSGSDSRAGGEREVEAGAAPKAAERTEE